MILHRGADRRGIRSGGPLVLGTLLLAVIRATPALAQDPGLSWSDDVSHRIERTGPPSPLPVDLQFFVGERYTHDSNIFLSPKPTTSDSILTSFGRVKLQYADTAVDIDSDLLADYNSFLQNHSVSADEERLYGRIRYTGSEVFAELGEVFRRESSPLDVVFPDRSRRTVSDTLPRIGLDWQKGGTIDASADIQDTQFQQQAFRIMNNLESRILLTVAQEIEGGMTLLLDGGYQSIHYASVSTVPDVEGYFARAGGHGELLPTVTVDARVGVTSVTTQTLPGTTDRIRHSTVDAEAHIRTEPNDRITLYADYTRRIVFGLGEPFQTVDLADLIAEYAVDPDFKIRVRGQADRSHGSSGELRSYRQISLGASYTILGTMILDGDVTFRRGRSQQLAGQENFDDTLVSAGVAITF